MLRPLTTLPLPNTAILELRQVACQYLDDVKNAQDLVHKYEEKLLEQVPTTISALDLWQEELRCDHLTTLSDALDNILDGGFQCKEITEICGAYGSGKSQICMQMSIVAQLPKECGGLNSQSLYIDTRNGFSPTRILDIIRGCQKRFPNSRLDETQILKGINVVSPQSSDQLLSVIKTLKDHLSNDSKIRVVIIDSLSLPVQCSLEGGWQRTEFYFSISNVLHKIATYSNVAVIVVNELRSHIDAKGEIAYASAGGQLVAHRINKRLVVARLNDATFAARILKAPAMPQVSVKFSITEDGVRDGKSKTNPKRERS